MRQVKLIITSEIMQMGVDCFSNDTVETKRSAVAASTDRQCRHQCMLKSEVISREVQAFLY